MAAKKQYPRLYKLLQEVAADNELQLKHADHIQWPDWDWDLRRFDGVCKRMSNDELVDFACGEGTVIHEIVRSYSCPDLHEFVEEAFQGELYDTFFTGP